MDGHIENAVTEVKTADWVFFNFPMELSCNIPKYQKRIQELANECIITNMMQIYV